MVAPRHPVQGQKICVLGAGMVGVCTALELQARGADVTLIDRREPGQETSWGNAGVLARSSLVPLNNPSLWKNLAGMIGNRSASLRYDPKFLLQNLSWLSGFLSHCTAKNLAETSAALDGLIQLSMTAHRRMIFECGLEAHLSDKGWLLLYRNEAAFDRAALARDVMAKADVATELLSAGALRDLEPGLNPIFARALWVRDAWSFDDPGTLVSAYARAFVQQEGKLMRAEARGLSEGQDGVTIQADGADVPRFDRVVMCLGPWGRRFLERCGYRVPMAYERGYHRHYPSEGAGGDNAQLSRPIHDTGGGYVLSPMGQGLRLTTGVELCAQEAAPNHRQMHQAEAAAREAIALGDPAEDEIWLGSRPTFPDSRPMIGALPQRRRVWVSFGHQHIGFSTGPGSARLLADLMEGRAPPIPAAPFRTERFLRRR